MLPICMSGDRPIVRTRRQYQTWSVAFDFNSLTARPPPLVFVDITVIQDLNSSICDDVGAPRPQPVARTRLRQYMRHRIQLR
jgi:hypothetical protein